MGKLALVLFDADGLTSVVQTSKLKGYTHLQEGEKCLFPHFSIEYKCEILKLSDSKADLNKYETQWQDSPRALEIEKVIETEKVHGYLEVKAVINDKSAVSSAVEERELLKSQVKQKREVNKRPLSNNTNVAKKGPVDGGRRKILKTSRTKLCQELSSSLPTWRTVDLRNQILATIRLFATPESYRSVADRFNFSKGQLHGIVGSVCHALVGLRQSYIKWPSTAELQGISDECNVYGFPGIVGAIDGTYIPVQGMFGGNRDSYICRKGLPAMYLKVVCDRRMVFRDVQTGYPGSVHDSRVFKRPEGAFGKSFRKIACRLSHFRGLCLS